ncbi:MAG: hypothetical protein KAZ26_20050 [Caldilineaceae bacterium]|nr:hypothetical protein [Caldilineaceae bacterium]
MTPQKKAWDTRRNPINVAPVLDQRPKLAHFYRTLYALGFGPFAGRNAEAEGVGAEWVQAEAAMQKLCERLEAQP